MCNADNLSCLPASTSTYAFDQGKLILSTSPKQDPQRYYLFTSKSPAAIWLDIAVHPGSASAGWASVLQPGLSSIIAMDKPTFVMRCTKMGLKRIITLDCQTVLDVCQLKTPIHIDGKTLSTGSFWAKENFKLR
jgi:hypothetical protein